MFGLPQIHPESQRKWCLWLSKFKHFPGEHAPYLVAPLALTNSNPPSQNPGSAPEPSSIGTKWLYRTIPYHCKFKIFSLVLQGLWRSGTLGRRTSPLRTCPQLKGRMPGIAGVLPLVSVSTIHGSNSIHKIMPLQTTCSCRNLWVILLHPWPCSGDAYNDADRSVVAGYDNGDIKMFDLRNMALRWETNVKNGVPRPS